MHAVGRFRRHSWLATALIVLALSAACWAPAAQGPLSVTATATPTPIVQVAATLPASATGHPGVSVLTTHLAPPSEPCLGRFVTHELDHVTTVPGETVDQFETNGAGVAIGDLDGDGWLDVVLANDAGANTILWNQGGLRFQTERLPHGDSRAASLVDVDGDGRLDMVFSRRTGALTFWHNQGRQPTPQVPGVFHSLSGLTFRQQVLAGISKPTYALNWADLDRDGDLDLLTGSYDAGLLNDLGNSFLLHGGGGVWIYENRDGRFSGSNLAPAAQAMAIVLFDVNRDGRQDIVVGNDFGLPDYVWLDAGGSWQPAGFDTTSHSTMSLDAGDVDNDGIPELFSTDMMPYADDPETVAAWEPIMADMVEGKERGDPQIMSNVLQVYTGITGYQNAARPRGVDASGWSWSAKFGDLDQDGLQDLYVVNGFIESTMFAHLSNHELVEHNQALRNIGDGYFRPARQWRLDSTASGRGMSMADLDADGDLDVVVNNLRSPAQLFENRLCGGDSLQLELEWPGSGNSRAIGAVVTLQTDAGLLTRDVRAMSGYLSGDPPRLHFGLPRDTKLDQLEVLWPDGARTTISDIQTATHLTVTRDDGG